MFALHRHILINVPFHRTKWEARALLGHDRHVVISRSQILRIDRENLSGLLGMREIKQPFLGVLSLVIWTYHDWVNSVLKPLRLECFMPVPAWGGGVGALAESFLLQGGDFVSARTLNL